MVVDITQNNYLYINESKTHYLLIQDYSSYTFRGEMWLWNKTQLNIWTFRVYINCEFIRYLFYLFTYLLKKVHYVIIKIWIYLI